MTDSGADSRGFLSYELQNWESLVAFISWVNGLFHRLLLHEYQYTPNEVIRMVAEKEGGARYDEMIRKKMILMKE